MLSAESLWEYCRTCLVKIEETYPKTNEKCVSIKKFPDLRNFIHVCLSKSTVEEENLCNYAPFICRSCFDKWTEFSKLYHIAVKNDDKIKKILKHEISKISVVIGENGCGSSDEEKNDLLNRKCSVDEHNTEKCDASFPFFNNNQLININFNNKHRKHFIGDLTQTGKQQNSEYLELALQNVEDSKNSFADKCGFSAEVQKRSGKIKRIQKVKNFRGSTYKMKNVRLKSSKQKVLANKDNKIVSGFGDIGVQKIRFQCKECNKYFWERNKYDGHMKQLHEGIHRPYKCHQCDKSYNLYKTLLQHIRERHGEKNQEVFKCEQCDKIFKTRVILKQHLNNKHSEQKESMRSICDQCGFIAAHQYSLTRHIINRHTETDQIKCDQCPKVFKTRYSLKYHIIGNHNLSNIKPFKCTDCLMEFTRKTLLNQHKRTHLKYTERIKCDFEGCKVRFVKRGDKTHHMRLVHLKIKQHICDFCGEAFGAMQTLRHHRFIHTGEKPYKCNVCGQGFRQRTAMKTHRKIHFGKDGHDLINLPETNLSLLNKVIS